MEMFKNLDFFRIFFFFWGAFTFVIITRKWQNRFLKALLSFVKANEYIYKLLKQSFRFESVA